jgi:putative hydrolase of the HAD superfamily
MEASPVEIVLFDLGGVLIEFGGVEPMKDLAGIHDDEELWRRWLGCPWVRDFERGRCSSDDFASGVIDEWGLPIDATTFLASFRSWPRAPMPGADALLRDVARTTPIGCLSNTNTLHWNENARRWAILDAFEYRFLSFELGLVKPDREIFDRVAASLPASPAHVLFLDDNSLNVDGALAPGTLATRAWGADEAHDALVRAGVLAADGPRA